MISKLKTVGVGQIGKVIPNLVLQGKPAHTQS